MPSDTHEKNAKVAVITTLGFRDIFHLAREATPELKIFEAMERVDQFGSVERELDENLLRRDLEKAGLDGVELLKICLLHSTANDNHENRVAEIAREAGFEVELSSEAHPDLPFIDRLLEMIGMTEETNEIQDPELLEKCHPIKVVQSSFVIGEGKLGEGVRLTIEAKDAFDTSNLQGEYRNHIKWMETRDGNRRILPESFRFILQKGERISMEVGASRGERFRKSPYFFQYDFDEESTDLVDIPCECMGRVALQGHRLRFIRNAGRMVSDVLREADGEVWGILHRLTSKDIKSLKLRAGEGRELKPVYVTDENGQCIEAWTYSMSLSSQRESRPEESTWYSFYRTALHTQFPRHYQESLISLRSSL